MMNYEQATSQLNEFIGWAKQYRREGINYKEPPIISKYKGCERALSLRRLHQGEGDVYMTNNQNEVIMILDQSGNFNNLWFDVPQKIKNGGIDSKAWLSNMK